MSNNFNFEYFKKTIEEIKAGSNEIKRHSIIKLLSCEGLHCHISNNDTNRGVFSICETFEYPHELSTATKLIFYNYDVVFVPNGYFKRNDKKFDVFLCRDHILFECDLKCITSTNPDTIGKRIKEGSHQANRLVIDVQSGIKKKELIEGLKTGCEKNAILKEIMLLYNSRFHRLFIGQILSDKIFDLLK